MQLGLDLTRKLSKLGHGLARLLPRLELVSLNLLNASSTSSPLMILKLVLT